MSEFKLSWYDIAGFAAFLSNVYGNLLLARQRADGWYVRIVSILLWGLYGWSTASLPMLANAATFLGINIYGLYKWKKKTAS